ncbi:uncharacterized protein LOC120260469 [Dioscorea cayenensis subsp. rotundata]|uniref:Uncharacterized protein LOC120260469 n=1 Tax=Dioscorea cayennensis subsp. rotundata TaxID=55577 RepID=A0AB40B9B2_DIOCR|nr:uncharacterized protein LOC120260469 [Dioscorea cayenensis subsp. rotundata]
MDEFSFPTIVGEPENPHNPPFPHFATLPVWFVTGAQRPHQSSPETQTDSHARNEEEEEDESECLVDEEERMDMLWEDFNEELHKDVTREEMSSSSDAESGMAQHGAVELCCVPKTRNMLRHQRPSLVIMLKVLKKLILIQKTSASKKASIYQV